MTLEPKKIKSVTISTFSPSISHEVSGSPLLDAVFHLLRSGPSLVKRTQRLGAQVAELGAFQDPDGTRGEDLFRGNGRAR